MNLSKILEQYWMAPSEEKFERTEKGWSATVDAHVDGSDFLGEKAQWFVSNDGEVNCFITGPEGQYEQFF